MQWLQTYQSRIGCCQRLWLRLISQPPEQSMASYFHLVSEFSPGEASLRANAAGKLHSIAEKLKKDPALSIFLVAGTDHTGSAAFNQALRRQRQQSLYDWLQAQGVDESQLHFLNQLPTNAQAPDNPRFVGYILSEAGKS